MTNQIRKYGLIGYPLSHSFSPNYFRDKFAREGIIDADYQSYPIEDISDVFVLFEEGLLGLNVTIPYKEKVIPLLDSIDSTAEAIGAVNTIKKNGDSLIGYNTDYNGFTDSIRPLLHDDIMTKCMILGSGGASKAVAYSMNQLDYNCTVVSRSRGDLLYKDIDDSVMQQHKIIVNTTPLGMSPNQDTYPDIPYQLLTADHLLYDLIYNPKKSMFLAKAEQKGATIINGLQMLELQAEASWKIWNTK